MPRSSCRNKATSALDPETTASILGRLRDINRKRCASHRRPRQAGGVGARGFGDLAIRYGYQRVETSVMIAVIVGLVALVTLFVDHR